MMTDFDNPLDQELLEELYRSKREVLGDDITRPRQFIIGRLNTDGTVAIPKTVVTDGEYGRVWVREPGEDTGDAVQAINTTLQAHEISFNRPVMVKQVRGELLIVGKSPESANYDAQLPVRPQRAINREQYKVAMIYPSQPTSSFFAYYAGGFFQLNNTAYRIADAVSSDFSGDVPGSNAISIKVEIDPVTGTWYETTGSSFTFSSMLDAYKNGDLDTSRTFGRFLIGWIRLYAGQAAVELDDIFLSEHMLDLIDDHGALDGLLDDDHPQYVYKSPGSDSRNVIQPTGDFNALAFNNQFGVLKMYIEETGDIITRADRTDVTILGNDAGRASGGASTFIGELAGQITTGSNNTFVGWEAGGSNTTGGNNTGIGTDAMWQNVSGFSNTAIGQQALDDLTSGNNNVALGYKAGQYNQTGSGNVYVGYDAGSTDTGLSNELYIHNSNTGTPLIYGDFSTGKLLVNSGNLAGNTTINGTQVSAHYDLGLVGDGVLMQKETATPTADTGYGKTYTKANHQLFFQDGVGVEHPVTDPQPHNGFEKDPDGAPPTDSTISYNPATRTIGVAPTGASFNYWLDGVKYIITSNQELTHADVTGNYFFYWNSSNVLTLSTTPWSIHTDVPIALVYYSATLTDGIYFEERHGADRALNWHYSDHFKRGTYWDENGGLGISSYTLQPASPSDSDNQWAVASGTIHDEDIAFPVTGRTAGTYEIWYRSGASGEWVWTQNNVPLLEGGSYLYYNEWTGATWQQTAASNNNYINYYIMTTSSLDSDHDVFVIMSQNVYSSLLGATSEAISDLDFGTLPFQEVLSIYKVTFRTGAAYSSEGKCRIEALADTRTSSGGQEISAAPSTNHPALSGLDWATSGHVGTVSTFAGFDVGGAATTYPITDYVATAGDTMTGKLIHQDSATNAPTNTTERSAAPSSPVTHDIYLDDGTNTASGYPGWRRYNGATWEDIGATVGGSSQWTNTSNILHPTSGAVTNVVLGGTTTANSDIILGVDGSAVFNEQGAAVDFRIEGDTKTHLFFADGSTDRIGINNDTPAFIVDAVGLSASGGSTPDGFRIRNNYIARCDLNTYSAVAASTAPQLNFSKARGNIATPATIVTGDRLASISFFGHDGTDLATPGMRMIVDSAGTIASNSIPTITTFLAIDDGDTSFTEFYRFGVGGNVFNEGGADIDFRVEGDTNTHLFFVDAGQDRIGINTSSISALLHIDQSDSTSGLPVLRLDQDDTSEPFITFIGQDQGVISSATSSAASLYVTFGTTKYRLALYAL
jgi:hypothetical protein